MNPTIASLLGWTINQHSVIAFALYVSGLISYMSVFLLLYMHTVQKSIQMR